MTASPLRIVVANHSLVGYPEAGGLWMWLVQYLLGLRDLRHDVLWLESFKSTGDLDRDRHLIGKFFDIFATYGLRDSACVIRYSDSAACELDSATIVGRSRQDLEQFATSADLLWNIASSLRQPLLSLFKRRVLIDVDPGHWQISALDFDMGQRDHDVFLTVGGKINDRDCEVPQLGLTWKTFVPFVYLPLWQVAPTPGLAAPFVSVTQWNWDQLVWGDRIVSIAKRDAYLRHIDLPQRCGRPFELAANILPQDQTGDRELLGRHGWNLVDPHVVAGSPRSYQSYIHRSRAELSCPKPVFRELRTGWLSDRSACFLASGRPVLAEETGISDHFDIDAGLVTFGTTDEAVEKVAEIDANYDRHRRAAREFAETYLDSRRCLTNMLDACQ
jgi:hypothetical protein